MKKFIELDYTEQQKISTLFYYWLKPYTHEVIKKILERQDEIINNEFAMNLLKELADRTIKENNEFKSDIAFMMQDFENLSECDPHNHPITHAGSYRDILYDMYIK